MTLENPAGIGDSDDAATMPTGGHLLNEGRMTHEQILRKT
jgi:hypothetical protein